MKPEVRKYFTDILALIQEVDVHIVFDKGFEPYSNDRRSHLIAEAVHRNWRAGRSDGSVEMGIELNLTARIIGFRNRVSHDHDMIDQAVVRTMLSRHIPIHKAEVQALLNQASS